MAGLPMDRPFTPSELRALMQGGQFTPSQLRSGLPPVNASQAPTAGVVDREALRNLRNAPRPPVGTTTTAVPKQPVGMGARIANGLIKVATSPVARAASGAGMMLYPSSLGAGTLDSPEAQRAMAANRAAEKSTQVAGFEGDVPIIQGARGQTYNTPAAVKKLMNTSGASIPVPAPTAPVSASDTEGALSYLGNAKALQDVRNRSQVAQQTAPLISSGFRSLNNPAINAPISGEAPGFDENILVKERFGTPQEYTAAVQSNQNATRFGQQAGLAQSFGAKGYAPNDATKAGMEYGGAITEYAIPGKGKATFMGQRQGGGSFSVGGRSPEEQAAINESVKQIESQTAAMRGLRNANRLAEGGITVEQQDQLNAMQQAMGQLAPRPNMSRLDEQQAMLMQQLKDAQGIKGFGLRRQREAAMDAAKLGLAQLANQRSELGQQYGQQAGLAQNMMQNQAAQEAAQAKALQDQTRFLADYGLRQEANQIAGQKNELDAAQAGARAAWEQQQFGGNTALKQQEAVRQLFPSAQEQKLWYTEDINNPGKPILNPTATGLSALPSDKAQVQPGSIYLQGEQPVFIDENGNPKPIEGGLGMAVFLNRALQMKKLGAI